MSVFAIMYNPQDKEQVEGLQKFMDEYNEEMIKYIEKLMEELGGVSAFCAMDVAYLRTRSRWTQELEERLIQEHKEGKKININEWPS